MEKIDKVEETRKELVKARKELVKARRLIRVQAGTPGLATPSNFVIALAAAKAKSEGG